MGSTGGDVIVMSGVGSATSSGAVSISSADAGISGVSGDMTLYSGASTAGDSGAVQMSTGKAVGGSGGNIKLAVGTGDTGAGGNLTATAGESTDALAAGGNMVLSAGKGSSPEGGRGGTVAVAGGKALGSESCLITEYDCGGVIVPSAVYDAVKRGCTMSGGSGFYGIGIQETRSYVCGTVPVSAEEFDAVMEGCSQRCAGGSVEMSGG